MLVWLLHIGEQLPGDGPMRLFRYGYLAEALQQAGHDVVRWAPTFCHVRKTQRHETDARVRVTPRYQIQFVHAPGYLRNASYARLRMYRILGQRFHALAAYEQRPDVIVAAIPSLEWAAAAVNYGRSRNIPVVVDVRDLWPDVFPSAMPAPLRPAAHCLLGPYHRLAQEACRGAAALAAVSQTYLNWALRRAGRQQSSRDFVAPLGYEPQPLDGDLKQQKLAEFAARGINSLRPTCFFAGSLERHHEVATIIKAAKQLSASGRNDVQFIICGAGSQRAALEAQARTLPQVHFLGWVDAATLQTVASIAEIGLAAYAPGAMMSLGNKPYEYMAGRLAIVSSLPGELSDILARQQCGLTYRAGDAASLAGCISELVGDPPRLGSMRSHSYQTWRAHYRSTEIYAQYVQQLVQLGAAAKLAA